MNRLVLTIGLWILLAGGGPALAREIALVIGNDTYAAVPSLRKAVADADAMAERLDALGFDVVRTADLDRDAMSRALVDLDARIRPGDTVFVFYAGHGFAIDGENYLLPTDVPAAGPGEAELVRDASFAVSRIVERLQRRGAGTAILVLDACRDNPFARPGQRSLAGSRGLARVDPPEGVFVLFSAGSGQAALDRLSDADEARNSVFTRVLLEALDRPGLSLVRIAKETQVAVKTLAATVGHDQTPAYYDQIIGDVILNRAGGPGASALPSGPQNASPPLQVARLPVPADPLSGAADLSRAGVLYEQARAAEARGDALGARRAYLALVDEGLDVVDPYLRFAALLRIQDGRAGAREILGDLADRSASRSLALVHLLQFEGGERRRRLDAFLDLHPDFGPAFYQAALEFTADRLGSEPVLTERRVQADLLDAFLEAGRTGTLARHFLDRSMLSDWLDDAASRRDRLAADLERAGAPTATFMRHNAGWSMTVQLPEPATAILWRDPATGAMIDTGQLSAVDPRTGKPMANPSITLPPDQPAGTIEIAYLDATGREAGPFPIRFEPRAQLYAGQKQILESLHTSWVSMRDYDGRLLMYTTMLVSYGCAIKEARYGLDDAPPTTPVDLPPCNEANPGAIPNDFQPYMEIPHATERVNVEITWYDGTVSRVATIPVR